MLFTLIFFLAATYFAYGYETILPLAVLVFLHVSQLILAGIFKLSYVVRLVAQKQLGLSLK